VVVTGNVKHEPLSDTAGSADLWRRLLGFGPNRRVWIAGSTHRGEEEVVLDAHRTALRECSELALVIAPRHPERAQEVQALVTGRGWPVVLRSERGRGRRRDAVAVPGPVGELRRLSCGADHGFGG